MGYKAKVSLLLIQLLKERQRHLTIESQEPDEVLFFCSQWMQDLRGGGDESEKVELNLLLQPSYSHICWHKLTYLFVCLFFIYFAILEDETELTNEIVQKMKCGIPCSISRWNWIFIGPNHLLLRTFLEPNKQGNIRVIIRNDSISLLPFTYETDIMSVLTFGFYFSYPMICKIL